MTPPSDPILRQAWIAGARQMAEVIALRFLADGLRTIAGAAHKFAEEELEPIEKEAAPAASQT